MSCPKKLPHFWQCNTVERALAPCLLRAGDWTDVQVHSIGSIQLLKCKPEIYLLSIDIKTKLPPPLDGRRTSRRRPSGFQRLQQSPGRALVDRGAESSIRHPTPWQRLCTCRSLSRRLAKDQFSKRIGKRTTEQNKN